MLLRAPRRVKEVVEGENLIPGNKKIISDERTGFGRFFFVKGLSLG
jgi:hypothetical protein